jgi:hypothetical protein
MISTWTKPLNAALAVAMLLAGASSALAASQEVSPDDQFLDQLVGTWDMEGTVGETPVHYIAIGERTLSGSWVEFHMQDRATGTRGYEARVFLGYDTKKQDFIAHWLDQFGAPGARVAGRGYRLHNTLHLGFPYEEGAFENTWTFIPDKKEWTLEIWRVESDGDLEPFAKYALRPHVTR